MTAPAIATMRLQMLRPVTPVIPKMPEKIRPPTIAPTMPRTMSMIMPEPVLFTILLPMKPAISPRMIQLITPMFETPSAAGRSHDESCHPNATSDGLRGQQRFMRDRRSKRKPVFLRASLLECAQSSAATHCCGRSEFSLEEGHGYV